MKNILQTEKQTFCFVCLKFMCNIHYYDDRRQSYTSLNSYSIRPIVSSYKTILTIMNTFKEEFSSDLLDLFIAEVKNYNDLYKIYYKKLKFTKCFDVLTDHIDLNRQKYSKENCSEKCYLCKESYSHINTEYINTLVYDDFIENTKFKYNISSREYILKCFDIYKYEPCKIKNFIKKVKFIEIDCIDVRKYYKYINILFRFSLLFLNINP